MHADLDFDVFKALTLLRQGDDDTLSDVIRRMLDDNKAEEGQKKRGLFGLGRKKGREAGGESDASPRKSPRLKKARDAKSGFSDILELEMGDRAETPPEPEMEGAWIANTYFPNGTKFRATYKGQTYFAEIADRLWLGEDGVVRTSPSDAARAITQNNVNGWRFWHALLPGMDEWRRMDAYKTR